MSIFQNRKRGLVMSVPFAGLPRPCRRCGAVALGLPCTGALGVVERGLLRCFCSLESLARRATASTLRVRHRCAMKKLSRFARVTFSCVAKKR